MKVHIHIHRQTRIYTSKGGGKEAGKEEDRKGRGEGVGFPPCLSLGGGRTFPSSAR
jgi:hypothetical protein